MARTKRASEVMVVPIREEAFATAKKLHVYAVPIVRSTSDVNVIAFYRGAPISAITHYADVKGINKNKRFDEVFPSGSAILLRENQPLKVYHLGSMVEMKRRVKKGRNAPISGPRYTDLETLSKARYLDEVWPPETVIEGPAKTSKATASKEPKAKRGSRAKKPPAAKKEAEAEPAPKRRRRGGKKVSDKVASPKAVEPVPTGDPEKKKRKRGSRGKGGPKTDGPSKTSKPNVHYIIDGANVALEARTFKEGGRLHQIELIMEKVAQLDGAVVTVIVDANLRHHIDRKDDLEVMIKDRRILQAPAQTDADEFILLTAEAHRSRNEDVVIISNDRYKDYLDRFKPRFNWVRDVRWRFMFVFSPDGTEVIEAMVSLK